MTPAHAVSLALEGATVRCTPDEYPDIRAALAEARELRPILSPSDAIDDAFTEAINALQLAYLR